MTWNQVQPVLDQLFFAPFLPHETAETRKEAIETFLRESGYTWDRVIDQIILDDTICA